MMNYPGGPGGGGASGGAGGGLGAILPLLLSLLGGGAATPANMSAPGAVGASSGIATSPEGQSANLGQAVPSPGGGMAPGFGPSPAPPRISPGMQTAPDQAGPGGGISPILAMLLGSLGGNQRFYNGPSGLPVVGRGMTLGAGGGNAPPTAAPPGAEFGGPNATPTMRPAPQAGNRPRQRYMLDAGSLDGGVDRMML